MAFHNWTCPTEVFDYQWQIYKQGTTERKPPPRYRGNIMKAINEHICYWILSGNKDIELTMLQQRIWTAGFQKTTKLHDRPNKYVQWNWITTVTVDWNCWKWLIVFWKILRDASTKIYSGADPRGDSGPPWPPKMRPQHQISTKLLFFQKF